MKTRNLPGLVLPWQIGPHSSFVAHYSLLKMQSVNWCFTINNPTEDDSARLDNLGRDLGDNGVCYLVYGREVGDNGTPHLQGYIRFRDRKRLRSCKDAVGSRAHCEPARGTPLEASDYCKKDGDFVEYGEPPTARKKSESVADFCAWVSVAVSDGSVLTEREVAIQWPGLYLRYSSKLMQLVCHLTPLPVMELNELRGWQVDVFEELMNQADDRKVKFVVDVNGGEGKTYFCRYMVSNYNDKVQVLSSGKRDDIAHAIDVTKSIFLFNIPRGGMEFLQYTIVEGLKDRIVFSPKYNSVTKLFRTNNHVVVFCNEMPDMTKLSRDRYDVVEL